VVDAASGGVWLTGFGIVSSPAGVPAVSRRPEHPLALFLDDLQWLNAATLDMAFEMKARAKTGPRPPATRNPDRWADIGDRLPRAHRNRCRRTLGIVVSSLLKFALAIL
jgi:hypothetical protein